MSEIRLSKVLKELSITLNTASDFLESAGLLSDSLNRNSKIPHVTYEVLKKEFAIEESGPVEEKVQIKKEKPEPFIDKNEESFKKEDILTAPATVSGAPRIKISKVEKRVALSPIKPKSEPKVTSTVQIETKEEIKRTENTTPLSPSELGEVADKDRTGGEVVMAKAKITTLKPLRKLDLTTPKSKKSLSSSDLPTNNQVSSLLDEAAPISKKVDFSSRHQKLKGVSDTGRVIDLSQFEKKVEESTPKTTTTPISPPSVHKQASTETDVGIRKKRKRIRIGKEKESGYSRENKKEGLFEKPPRHGGGYKDSKRRGKDISFSKKDVVSDRQIVATTSRYRKQKRKEQREREEIRKDIEQAQSKIIRVTEFITISELAALMDVSVSNVMDTCTSLGLAPSMNQSLDRDTLSLVVEEYGFTIEIILPELEVDTRDDEDDPADLVPRPPVVTVMGHVDHGKTSLLDYLRKSKVVSREAGGITQHMGAYSVDTSEGKRITFLDTPGHEAFTEMRSRGVKMTDVVIVVISAEDGVKPRTEESIAHAQAANIPIVFAVNKIDKPNANPQLVRQHLAERNILVDDFGGKYASQDISAKTGQGIEELLEKVLFEAEVMELKANPKAVASGVVIDSFMQKGRGYMSTFLVQRGVLKKGDVVVAGQSYGKIKSIMSDDGRPIKTAALSLPVTVLGLNGSPSSGDRFRVYASEREAKTAATSYSRYSNEQSARIKAKLLRSEMDKVFEEGLSDIQNLNVILRADVDGSLGTILEMLKGLSSEDIKVNVLLSGVGQITESDVSFAVASDAMILGFGVKPIPSAKNLAETKKVQIHLYTVIYRLSEDIQKMIEGMVDTDTVEEVLGSAEVKNVYKKGTIAGCVVLKGKITHKNKVKITRGDETVYDDLMRSLKHFETDVPEVAEGSECGIGLKESFRVRVGDLITCYK